MNILKKVILKYINDKDIGYSILSALWLGCSLRNQNQNTINIKILYKISLTEVSETADCGRKSKSEISKVSRPG
jgi:hypothetical protein